MGSVEQGIYRARVTSGGALVRLVRYRDSLVLLTARALKVRYRRSVIGFGWALLYPLIAMTVLTAVFSNVFPEIPQYSLYVVIGVLVWGFFSLACVQAMDALLGGAPVLRKVYVPSAIFPIAAIGANFANFLLALLVLPILMAYLGAWPGLHPLWLATGLLSLTAFTLGVGLMLAAVNVFFNDVRYFFEALLLVWFYATPVVYPAQVIPDHLSALLVLNPLYWFLELLRAALYRGSPPAEAALIVAPLIGIGALAVGWVCYSRLERRFHLYL